MGKNKLRKFSELNEIDFVYQYPFARLQAEGFPHRGRWREVFGNDNPIVLELGCGKGEYTVALARSNPDRNYIGIDIKGARMHRGASDARDEGLANVAFIRTGIEMLDSFFAPGEVSEIWVTFPDPQMKKAGKRLTGTRFCELYRRVASTECRVHLKTDSPFLYTYTERMARANGLPIDVATDNLYADGSLETMPWLGIQTHYERQWLSRGLTIKYLRFALADNPLTEPDTDDIPLDGYRSTRGRGTNPETIKQ